MASANSGAAAGGGPSAGVLKMRELIQSHGQTGWDEAWKAGITPWDSANGTSPPPLIELVEDVKYPLPTSGRAIVPGCGRGYDAAYFAKLGLESWGVDISPAAVDAAKMFVAAMPDAPSNVYFKALDFFNFDIPQGAFKLAYDHTFLCALPPSMREAWGKRFAEIVAPGGLLICHVFPIDGDRPGGPPYSLSVDTYPPLLEPAFERIYLEKPRKPTPGREGKEMMSIWKRK